MLQSAPEGQKEEDETARQHTVRWRDTPPNSSTQGGGARFSTLGRSLATGRSSHWSFGGRLPWHLLESCLVCPQTLQACLKRQLASLHSIHFQHTPVRNFFRAPDSPRIESRNHDRHAGAHWQVYHSLKPSIQGSQKATPSPYGGLPTGPTHVRTTPMPKSGVSIMPSCGTFHQRLWNLQPCPHLWDLQPCPRLRDFKPWLCMALPGAILTVRPRLWDFPPWDFVPCPRLWDF